MSRLYEGESVEIYDPTYGTTTEISSETHVYSDEQSDDIIRKARMAQELLASEGFKILKADVDEAIKTYTEALISAEDPARIARYQATIRAYQNFEGFVNRYVLEGQLAMDNREVSSASE